jgi:adenosylmethionine-8-amino-7-oxononanoate aminotransferase
MHPLAKLDHQNIWHPFTQMRDWLKREPLIIIAGEGAVLTDVHGKKYLDANSSIWTNLHGHNHPVLNAAIKRQLEKIAHSSALGLANEPASLLAHQLVQAADQPKPQRTATHPFLSKVFFSDDGSTAMEVALKLAYEFTRRIGRSKKPRFLSLQGAYHGDTVGAVSLGHLDLFHKTFSGLLFKTDSVAAPYCYRCPFNRAKPERADARLYRKCNWECLGVLEQKLLRQKKTGNRYAGFVFEPLIQGAAGMIAQPAGWLSRATSLAREHGALLIADEVMTGFGRTGIPSPVEPRREQPQPIHPRVSTNQHVPAALFASQHEGVRPDFMALAKGLTGGYLPMAATLTSIEVFKSFLGRYDEFKTFFHGHSYTANQLGAAAALASINLLQSPASFRARHRLEQVLNSELQILWRHKNVGDVRRVGLIAGIELVRDWRTREPFPLPERAGIRVCEAMAKRGVLTRPVGNAIVIMPPYCTTADQVRTMIQSLDGAIATEL